MSTLESDVLPKQQGKRTSTRVKLVRDAIGGVQLATEQGEILQNVFVKQYERIEGSVTRLNLEVIFLASDARFKNW